MHTFLYSTRMLRERGLRPTDLHQALRLGTLARVRPGWYATPDTPAALLDAARVGGRLSCLDALRLHCAWTLGRAEVHVRVASGVSVPRASRVRIHWTADRVGPGLDPLDVALDVALRCCDLRALVVAVDSIVNRNLLTRDEVESLLRKSVQGRRVWALVDATADSGIETLVRLALRRRRIRVRAQVEIARVGRVDFLIGERLVVEVDGFEWHGDRVALERDRSRDRELVRRGYAVIRVTYRQALADLDAVVLAVADVVARREHRWRGMRRAQLSGEARSEPL